MDTFKAPRERYPRPRDLAQLAKLLEAMAEDGYDLWLRYRQLPVERLDSYRQSASELVPGAPSPTLEIAKSELLR